ncbi:uncharacterized protein [Manis javanica]|uniref:uncharacterized protein n=1 Tax=Manis javanica TaxID=9974 RepID=UPI003C6DB610
MSDGFIPTCSAAGRLSREVVFSLRTTPAVLRRKNAGLSRTSFTRALPSTNLSFRACFGHSFRSVCCGHWASTPARHQPTCQPDCSSESELRTPCAAKLKSTARPSARSVKGRFGSGQAVASPPTAAVRLNSGATPAPRRARHGRAESPGASGRAPGAGQAGGAHAPPRNEPLKERSRRARSRALSRTPPSGHAPVPAASNRSEREGGRARTRERLYRELAAAALGLSRPVLVGTAVGTGTWL